MDQASKVRQIDGSSPIPGSSLPAESKRSNKRSGHFIKSLSGDYAPTLVISLSIEGKSIAGESGSLIREYSLAQWSAIRHRRKGDRWSVSALVSGSDSESWWEYLSSQATCGRNIVIICHHAETCWTLLGGWKAIENGTVDFGDLQRIKPSGEILEHRQRSGDRCTLVLGRPTTIITHKIGSGRATWLAVGNYVETSLEDLASSVGVDGVIDSAPGISGSSFPFDSGIAARVIGLWFTRLIDRWKSGRCGPFRFTAAQLGHSLWRSQHYTDPVLIHDDPIAAEIERKSLFGGRASVWFWGRIGSPSSIDDPFAVVPNAPPYHSMPGPAFHLDVRSMYPWLMAHHAFPVCLHQVRGEMTVDELEEILRFRSAIATVDVDHSEGEIPLRRSTSTIFPNGEWTGSYAEPELREMIARREIRKVHQVAVYGRAPAFQSFAKHILGERIRCRLAGDEIGESLAKIVGNGFAGKFASKGGGWQTDPDICPEVLWGEWIDRCADTGKIERRRSFGGICQRLVERSDKPTGSPAIFSHLTSLGRCFMRKLRSVCPPRSVYHQDTDGLWCSGEAVQAIRDAGYRFGDSPGELRIDCESRFLQFLSPKHYCYDGNWVLSGIATGFSPHAGNAFDDLVISSASSSKMESPVSWVNVVKRSIVLDTRGVSETIDSSGWAFPGKYDPTREDSGSNVAPRHLFDS